MRGSRFKVFRRRILGFKVSGFWGLGLVLGLQGLGMRVRGLKIGLGFRVWVSGV